MMDADEWLTLMQVADVLDAEFTSREAKLCFVSSKMWVSDVEVRRRAARVWSDLTWFGVWLFGSRAAAAGGARNAARRRASTRTSCCSRRTSWKYVVPDPPPAAGRAHGSWLQAMCRAADMTERSLTADAGGGGGVGGGDGGMHNRIGGGGGDARDGDGGGGVRVHAGRGAQGAGVTTMAWLAGRRRGQLLARAKVAPVPSAHVRPPERGVGGAHAAQAARVCAHSRGPRVARVRAGATGGGAADARRAARY